MQGTFRHQRHESHPLSLSTHLSLSASDVDYAKLVDVVFDAHPLRERGEGAVCEEEVL